MIRFRRFASGPIVLFVFLCATACAGNNNTSVTQKIDTASRAGEIVIEKYFSSSPDEFNLATLNCLRRKFALLEDVLHPRGEYGSAADYLSRFYAYTDAFHRAKRCDSFILAYHPDTEGELSNVKCHVAIFTYDSSAPVQQIQRLENRDTTTLRKRPAEGLPGSLTFKAGTEHYRVFFSETHIVFFFVYRMYPGVIDDPALYAAALELKECILPAE